LHQLLSEQFRLGTPNVSCLPDCGDRGQGNDRQGNGATAGRPSGLSFRWRSFPWPHGLNPLVWWLDRLYQTDGSGACVLAVNPELIETSPSDHPLVTPTQAV